MIQLLLEQTKIVSNIFLSQLFGVCSGNSIVISVSYQAFLLVVMVIFDSCHGNLPL